MPHILHTPAQMQDWRRKIADNSVGFVPTMGALHPGHESLLRKSGRENDLSVLSIFINPTQFGDSKDLRAYPQTWNRDLEVASRAGVDVVFAPTFELMYPDDYRYKASESDFSKKLCGADRPGHFDGVLTVVLKLLNLVRPDRAYFGEKDFQQLRLIQEMVGSFFLPTAIVPVPTVREADGLAMSSRNVRLSAADRARAPLIFKIISRSPSAEQARQELEAQGWEVDYVTDLENRRFVAVHAGGVRLIDNTTIGEPQLQ